jgi:hypothetical protein
VNNPISLPPLAAFIALMVMLARAVRRFIRRNGQTSVDRLVLCASFLYLSTMAIGVVFELGEQARLRAGLDPLAYTTVAIVLVRFVRNRGGEQADEAAVCPTP